MIKIRKRFNTRIFLVICLFFVGFNFLEGISRITVVCPKGDICELVGQNIRVDGKIISLRSERLEKTIVEIETEYLLVQQAGARYQQLLDSYKDRILVVLPHTQYELQYGDKIVIEGKIKLPFQDSKDNFSYPLYLAGKGIYSTMSYPEILKVRKAVFQENNPYNLYDNILDFRETVRRIINNYLSEPDSAIVNAMVIGDQGSIPQELRQELSETGIIHILSVSGAHVTLVIAILAFLFSLLTNKRLVIFLIVSFGVLFYLFLAGSPNCASRSAIMGLLAYLSLYKGKNPNLKTALWLSAAMLLFLNPLAIFSDVGFELSFLAMIGMVYVFPPLDKSLAWGRLGFKWKAIRVLLLSISISLTTIPLVYYYFGIVSWISPIANLILIPLFSLVLPAGFLLVSLGLISDFFPFVGIVINFLAVSIYFLLRLIYYSVDLILKIPGSYSEGAIKPGWIILYYILLFFLVSIFHYLVKKYILFRRLDYFSSEEFLNPKVMKRRNLFLRRRIRKLFKKSNVLFSKNKLVRNVFTLLLIVACCMSLASVGYLYLSSRPPRLVMLDVEQGDAFLLNWPSRHLQIVIDGGLGRRILPGLGLILPFYDKKVEIVVLSHPHQDHIEGLINILSRYKVSQAILSSLPQRNIEVSQGLVSLQDDFWKKLIKNKIPISLSRKGQKIFFDAGREKIAELEFLSPFFDYSQNTILNLNDQSAVLKLNYPRKVLFMGDSSNKAENVFLARGSHNLKCEVLKIGHHGSRFSSLNEFLDVAQPKTALISAGKDNLYGHPAKITLKKLEERNIETHRTDINGKVEISLEN